MEWKGDAGVTSLRIPLLLVYSSAVGGAAHGKGSAWLGIGRLISYFALQMSGSGGIWYDGLIGR